MDASRGIWSYLIFFYHCLFPEMIMTLWMQLLISQQVTGRITENQFLQKSLCVWFGSLCICDLISEELSWLQNGAMGALGITYTELSWF